MRLDISQLAWTAGVKTAKVLPPIVTTAEQAKALARIYLRPVKVWSDLVPSLMEIYSRTLAIAGTRDSVGELELEINRTDQGILNALLSWRNLVGDWAGQLSTWHLKKMVSNLKYASNVDLGAVMGGTERGTETLEAVLNRNVALIKAVSDQTRERISDIVFRGMTSRTPTRQVAREIATATGMSRARALRIASDQTVKLSAALDRQRMRDVGIEEFQWMHSGKAHPREWHKARNGKIFRLDDPKLRGDMPGDQPFCGCKARGIVGDVEDLAEPVSRPKTPRPRKPKAETPAARNDRLDAETKKYILDSGRKTNTEYIAGFDRDTGFEFARSSDGKHGQVSLTNEMLAAVTDPKRNVDMHHNHPNSRSFSTQDYQVVTHYKGMSSIWAHGHNGSSYQATRGANQFFKPYAYEVTERTANKILSPMFHNGTMTRAEYEILYHHTISLLLDKYRFFNYRFELAAETADAWNRHKAAIMKAVADAP